MFGKGLKIGGGINEGGGTFTIPIMNIYRGGWQINEGGGGGGGTPM